MTDLKDKTVAEIVSNDFRTAEVFRKFNIDFCCGGKVRLEDICMKKNVPLNDVLDALTLQARGSDSSTDFRSMRLTELIHHIVSHHHRYVKESIVGIHQYAKKVAEVHGEHRQELKEIEAVFTTLAAELMSHMMKEELVLFPYIEKLENNITDETPSPFGNVEHPISRMELEHETAGMLMAEIEKLSHHFSPPEEACNTYRVLYTLLNDFQNDLHTHVHLENNILFPAAIALEKSRLARQGVQ